MTAQSVVINVPNAGASGAFIHHGDAIPRGEVGEYVCFSRGDFVILGRLTKVELPERDRLSVEPTVAGSLKIDPIGHVSLLTDVDLKHGHVTGAVSSPPRLGTSAYSVSSSFLRWVLEAGSRQDGATDPVTLCIGDVAGVTKTPVTVSPERIFGRHCAVLGVTGGGKSWTIARLLEECAKHEARVVLIDATGEFQTLGPGVTHSSIGTERDAPDTTIEASCPYHRLQERDLFALFTPAGQSQAPLLRDAIRSLRLAQCPGLPDGLVIDGCIRKAKRSKEPFIKACKDNLSVIESTSAPFEVKHLSNQIQRECVYPSDHNDDGRWGERDLKMIGYSMSLLMRVESMVRERAFAPMFQPEALPAIQSIIDSFIDDGASRILRVSLRFLSFSQSIRPIVVNAIGRHLLDQARKGVFRSRPTVIVLDEAHQFLGKSVGDEGNSFALDAFDLIAKEGRKYGSSSDPGAVDHAA